MSTEFAIIMVTLVFVTLFQLWSAIILADRINRLERKQRDWEAHWQRSWIGDHK